MVTPGTHRSDFRFEAKFYNKISCKYTAESAKNGNRIIDKWRSNQQAHCSWFVQLRRRVVSRLPISECLLGGTW